MTYSEAIKYLTSITGKTEKEIINEIKRDLRTQNVKLRGDERDRVIRVAVKRFVHDAFLVTRVRNN